jgi:uncharacterized protein YcfJ
MMITFKKSVVAAAALATLVLTACVSLPSGPTYPALPGSSKTFEQFQVDDAVCRQYAQGQIGGRSASDVANQNAAGGAVAGTVIGAAAGAALGGRDAAGAGAVFGLLTGAAIGSENAGGSYRAVQRRYDGAYGQCMYAKGNKVAMAGRYYSPPSASNNTPSYSPPPPPRQPPPRVAPPADLPESHYPPPDAPAPR